MGTGDGVNMQAGIGMHGGKKKEKKKKREGLSMQAGKGREKVGFRCIQREGVRTAQLVKRRTHDLKRLPVRIPA